jgi:hypothetical protein
MFRVKFADVNEMHILYAALIFCKNRFSYKIDDNFDLSFV